MRSDLDKLNHIKVCALLTKSVWEKDVIKNLMEKKCQDEDAFNWKFHLRSVNQFLHITSINDVISSE